VAGEKLTRGSTRRSRSRERQGITKEALQRGDSGVLIHMEGGKSSIGKKGGKPFGLGLAEKRNGDRGL